MIIMPISQALAVNFASEEMRDHYMAIFSLAWAVPTIVDPGLAGLILDNYNPNLLWYLGGALCLFSVFSFYGLHIKVGSQKRFNQTTIEN